MANNKWAKTGQLLHRTVSNHRFNIVHRRTEESPAAEHFNGDENFVDMTVVTNCTATTHISAIYRKAGGSKPWVPHILWE